MKYSSTLKWLVPAIGALAFVAALAGLWPGIIAGGAGTTWRRRHAA